MHTFLFDNCDWSNIALHLYVLLQKTGLLER